MNNLEEDDINDVDEEIINDTDEERPLSHGEDVELDVREAFEEIKDPEAVKEAKSDERQQPDSLEKPQKEPEVEEEVIPPPASWKVDAKETFHKLPPEIKKEVIRREADREKYFTRATQEISQIKKRYQGIDEAIEPYREQWHISGVDEAKAVRALAAADHLLKTDFNRGMATLAQMRGKTLRQLADEVEGSGEQNIYQSNQSPFQQNSNSDLLNLQSKIQQLEERLLYEERAKEAAATESVLSEFHAVRDEMDYQGRYLRPELHDDQAVQAMTPIMQGLKQSFPELSPRELLLRAYSAYTGKPAIPTRTQPAQHVNNARKASLSVRGSSTSAASPKPKAAPDDPEEHIREIYREIGGI